MLDIRRDADYLGDILEAIQRIQEYTHGMNWEKFILDCKTQDVVLRNLEVIREASKNIAEEYKGQYPWLPWRDMAGARDKLIHHYFGVNLEVVWQIIEGDLPKVKLQIEEIFR